MKQPTFVREFASIVIPGANERDVVPANSSTGTVVLNLVPDVRTSELMMKRLLCVPPAEFGLENVTAPPPVKPLKTSLRKF